MKPLPSLIVVAVVASVLTVSVMSMLGMQPVRDISLSKQRQQTQEKQPEMTDEEARNRLAAAKAFLAERENAIDRYIPPSEPFVFHVADDGTGFIVDRSGGVRRIAAESGFVPNFKAPQARRLEVSYRAPTGSVIPLLPPVGTRLMTKDGGDVIGELTAEWLNSPTGPCPIVPSYQEMYSTVLLFEAGGKPQEWALQKDAVGLVPFSLRDSAESYRGWHELEQRAMKRKQAAP